MLLVIRFGIAALVLSLVFARRLSRAAMATRGLRIRLLIMAVVDSAVLLLSFVAFRTAGVALGMFLLFLAPVWVALIAPRVLQARTDPIVYVALVLALCGLCVILAPSLLGADVRLSVVGLIVGLAAGLGYAVFQLIVKDLTGRTSAVTIVVVESWLNVFILLPFAAWQMVSTDYSLTVRDLAAGLILGVACTVIAYLMWTTGVSRIKVQHSAVLGYLEPVSASIYALLLLGQWISGWTAIGGVLIALAGLLVIVFGEREVDGVLSPQVMAAEQAAAGKPHRSP